MKGMVFCTALPPSAVRTVTTFASVALRQAVTTASVATGVVPPSPWVAWMEQALARRRVELGDRHGAVTDLGAGRA